MLCLFRVSLFPTGSIELCLAKNRSLSPRVGLQCRARCPQQCRQCLALSVEVWHWLALGIHRLPFGGSKLSFRGKLVGAVRRRVTAPNFFLPRDWPLCIGIFCAPGHRSGWNWEGTGGKGGGGAGKDRDGKEEGGSSKTHFNRRGWSRSTSFLLISLSWLWIDFVSDPFSYCLQNAH